MNVGGSKLIWQDVFCPFRRIIVPVHPSPRETTRSADVRSCGRHCQVVQDADIRRYVTSTPPSHIHPADHVAEAQTSLTLLTELCPFFLTLKTIAKQDWLEMPAQVAQAPASPTTGILSSARLGSNLTSPSRSNPRGLISPGIALGREVDVEAIAGNGAIAGPASPGRVRRVGGLREVRERIRRELGE